jgi:conflict system STAND superfamily ATPase
LRRVIEQPAALPDVQLAFEGDLVQNLLSEVGGQAGALPLLQFTLDQLYQQRHGRQLTLEAYHEIGGVKGALSQHAERTYAALPSEEHPKLARSLFLRLIDPGMVEQDTTRRRAVLSEFALSDPTQTPLMRETMDAFIAARLLTTNEIAGTTTIEVSHEALIREWPRLADWLREAREDIRLQQTISKDAAEWEQRGKPGDRLYRGSQLKDAQAWAKRNTPSGDEVAFLRAGAASRVRFLVSVIAVLLILVPSMGGASWVLTHQPPKPPDPNRVSNTQDNDNPGSLRYAVDEAPSGLTRVCVEPFC